MKTKMIVVVVLAAMCVLPLSAQVKVGVEGGMNLSHYLVSGSDGYKAEQVGGMKPGFQLGVTVDYEIGKHWMLMSGLSWLQNRSTMKMMDHMVTYFPKTEIMYLANLDTTFLCNLIYPTFIVLVVYRH